MTQYDGLGDLTALVAMYWVVAQIEIQGQI